MKQPKFKDAIRGMTLKQKREYIWDYYKIHIISVLFVAAVGLYSAYEFSVRRDTYLNVFLTGGAVTMERVSDLNYQLNDILLTEEEQGSYTVLVQFNQFSFADEMIAVDAAQQLSVFLTTGEIDVLIVDEPTFEAYHQQGFLMPLSQVGFDFSGHPTFEAGQVGYGVAASELDGFEEIFPEGMGSWIAVFPITSNRPDQVERFLDTVLN